MVLTDEQIGARATDRMLADIDRLLCDSTKAEGMTRAEFESHQRVCYQHDNVRVRERGGDAPLHGLTAEQEREIAERVELNYPSSAYN
ncbi:hypothetical protein M0D66_19015 [Paraburkholderia sp. SECH2]|nr:hypothetical protein [Paraburkholderia sp. SECH2]